MLVIHGHIRVGDNEIEKHLMLCVKEIKVKKFSKRQIINYISLLIFKNNSFDFMQYTHTDKNIIKAAVLSQFKRMQRVGKLKFNHVQNKWTIIPNAEFPTLREDYDGL